MINNLHKYNNIIYMQKISIINFLYLPAYFMAKVVFCC